ncbi:MAG: response regulator, partial [Chthoniobacteraceae bacterium]
CKRVRDDGQYWNQIESYLTDHSDLHFSHGVCDKCLGIQKAALQNARGEAAAQRTGLTISGAA